MVGVRKERFEELIPLIQRNVDRLTGTGRPAFKMLKRHEFVPDDLCYQLPVLFKTGTEEWQCPICSKLIQDEFVPTIVCTKSKMHPECAAIAYSAVGPHIFECLGNMRYHELDDTPRPKPIKCNHVAFGDDDDISEKQHECLERWKN